MQCFKLRAFLENICNGRKIGLLSTKTTFEDNLETLEDLARSFVVILSFHILKPSAHIARLK